MRHQRPLLTTYTTSAHGWEVRMWGTHTSAASDLMCEILEALNSKKKKMCAGGFIFCDLEKAFDCIDRGCLSAKLEFYGITEHIA